MQENFWVKSFVPLCFESSQFISTAVKPGLSRALVARLGTDVLFSQWKTKWWYISKHTHM